MTEPQPTQSVRVVDFDVPFGQMIVLLLKWSLAAIPAAAVLVVVLVIFASILGGLTGLAP